MHTRRRSTLARGLRKLPGTSRRHSPRRLQRARRHRLPVRRLRSRPVLRLRRVPGLLVGQRLPPRLRLPELLETRRLLREYN